MIHDIALQNLPVVLCVDRAGLNEGDGATHHGLFDVAFLSHIPGLKIYTPITNGALRAAMEDALKIARPCAIRYPNGTESEDVCKAFYGDGIYEKPGVRYVEFGDGTVDLMIVTHGRIVTEALQAATLLAEEGISVGILLLEYIKPYCEIAKVAEKYLSPTTKVIFLEEEIRSGGMGMNLSDECIRRGYLCADSFLILATDDSFVDERAVGESIYEAAGVSASHVVAAGKQLLNKK